MSRRGAFLLGRVSIRPEIGHILAGHHCRLRSLESPLGHVKVVDLGRAIDHLCVRLGQHLVTHERDTIAGRLLIDCHIVRQLWLLRSRKKFALLAIRNATLIIVLDVLLRHKRRRVLVLGLLTHFVGQGEYAVEERIFWVLLQSLNFHGKLLVGGGCRANLIGLIH